MGTGPPNSPKVSYISIWYQQVFTVGQPAAEKGDCSHGTGGLAAERSHRAIYHITVAGILFDEGCLFLRPKKLEIIGK